jgi:hypothetical protein
MSFWYTLKSLHICCVCLRQFMVSPEPSVLTLKPSAILHLLFRRFNEVFSSCNYRGADSTGSLLYWHLHDSNRSARIFHWGGPCYMILRYSLLLGLTSSYSWPQESFKMPPNLLTTGCSIESYLCCRVVLWCLWTK